MASFRERLLGLSRRAGGTFAFSLKDLRTGKELRIKDEESFPAASVIKVPIMLALLERVGAGEVRLEDTMRLTGWHRTGGSGVFQHFHEGLEVTLEDACTAMVVLSDNTATNMVLDAVGIERVNSLLDRLGCHRTRLHRYFGKPDMPGPAGPSQMVPAEMARVLEAVWRGASSKERAARSKGNGSADLLTPELCRRALLFMRRQQHRALAPRLLPEGTVLAHKTGSLDGVRHDAGLLWLPRGEGEAGKREGQGARWDVMALPGDDLPDWDPVVFVAMSKGVPDLRWTVENRAEVTVARALRAVWEEWGKGL